MKKGYLLSIVFIIILCFCACTSKTEKELSNMEILEEFEETMNIPAILTNDLELKDEYIYKDKLIKASFESSDTRILSNNGKYYLSLENNFITLSATYTLDNETLEKIYDIDIKQSSAEALVDKAIEELNLPTNISGNIELPLTYKYGKVTLSLSYTSSNTDILTNQGIITLSKSDRKVNLQINAKLTSKNFEKTYNKEITVLAINQNKVIELLKNLNYNNEYEEDITLIDTINYEGILVDVTYYSGNKEVLSDDGKINPSNKKVSTSLTCKALDIEYTFDIDILPMSDELCITKALDEVYVSKKITSNIILPTLYSYGVSAKWESSDQSLLSNVGILSNNISAYQSINLKLTLSKGETSSEKTFNCIVGNESHMYLDKTFDGTLTNLEIVNGKMQLTSGSLSGTYIGKEISVNSFDECIASYAATSSNNATCELQIRVKSNNSWSRFFSYGSWGQGLNNIATNQNDTYFKMDTDEILAIGSNVANAFQLKLIVKRDNLDSTSPVISLLACTFNYVSYSYNADISKLEKDVKYDVPKLYQGAVPGIGGSICSATTSTMLLKYKGHNFMGLANYEHEYIAYIVKDYGHNIFGNWVYNTIGISSYGEKSYVKRMYSVNELIYHLATVGPVGCSVKGYVINGVKDYNTAGHLIVVTGYRINNDGSRVLYINDPNVPSVSVEMTETNFNSINRNVYYVVE